MHILESGKQGLHHSEQLICRDFAAALSYDVLEGRALYVFHYDIGGIVSLKEILCADYDRLLVHLGHGAGFLKEARLAFLISLAYGAGIIGHGQRGAGNAVCLIRWEVFLYGNLQLQLQIAADIGDAKAALAQYPAYQIPVPEDGSGRQMVRGRGIVACGESAVFTGGIGFHNIHAIRAKLCRHPITSLLCRPYGRAAYSQFYYI